MGREITKLPLTSRSAMDFVNFLPGVSTPDSNRNATINGLIHARLATGGLPVTSCPSTLTISSQ